ncbi:MAG: 4-hydroxy-3-methylbut-2-enyl diphosphate reductase [Isosphaeraceae bacterium]|nr:4-hydroxy-3-methylbut-2-enyl diphosphate reductase [Isosphaeraceae bacterium]
MRVIRADVMGMCFGVRDALKVIGSEARPQDVTIHGQLVHNERVLVELEHRGFAMNGESDRAGVPATPTVLITAHGISERERKRLEQAGKTLVDTTCPLVTRVHQAALSLQSEGYHVLLIGRPGHVEVQGIVEDLVSYHVVPSEESAESYPFPKLGVICQTTAASRNVEKVRAAIVAKNPQAEIKFVDTVCLPTKEHQRSLDRLLEEVDVMVVVGGRNSNNTRELVTLSTERGVPAYHVQGASDLDAGWFDAVETVGLTAGTSTLDETIDEVYAALLQLSAASRRSETLLSRS